jgi:hypothetical protein
LILGTVLIAKCRKCCYLHATVANLRHFHTKTWPAGCRISTLKPAKDRVFDYFGTLDGLWRSRQPKTFAWGANREPYSLMEYLPATGIADWPSSSGGGPSRCSDRRLAPIRLFARRPDRVRGRRRSGTTAGPSAPAAFETKSYQLAGAAAPAVYTFDAKPRDIQSAVVCLSYKFGAPVVAKY